MANGNGANKVLGEGDLTRINGALSQLGQADELIAMAKQAGIDVSQFQDRAKQSREQLLRIKNTFFPGR